MRLRIMSRPVRARGLKLYLEINGNQPTSVAPRTGAWIETQIKMALIQPSMPSRPVRARGLKPVIRQAADEVIASRPVRARGLKLPSLSLRSTTSSRRAPYGRVD